MNRDYILWNLKEAAEALSGIIAEVEDNPDYEDVELMIALQHLYHHVNTAWNAREASPAAVEECSEENFALWRAFPDDIPMGV
jgi:hypothetical protein